MEGEAVVLNGFLLHFAHPSVDGQPTTLLGIHGALAKGRAAAPNQDSGLSGSEVGVGDRRVGWNPGRLPAVGADLTLQWI